MPAKFVLRKARNRYTFELLASNGASIIKSGSYGDRRAATNAIAALRRNAAAEVEDTTAAAPRKTAAKRTAKKATTARKTTARKTTTPRKTTARKTTARKTTARKTTTPRKTTARKTTTRRAAPRAAAMSS